MPMIGVTIGERLRDKGYDVLLCFDDLSKHAKSYRQCSLLLGRVPARDAYSADIFNVHASLLERSAKLKPIDSNLMNLAASITIMPIIETINQDISEYIATNVISITDGQFYMSKHLFNLNMLPAIDSSLSVTRVGSNAQCK